MPDRPFAYICSPLRGDTDANMERAREYSRQVFEAGYCPITPHIYFPAFLRDNIPEEREAGMAMGESLLPQCRVLVVCGNEISNGMSREIRAAERLNIPILTLDVFLPETVRDRPPAAPLSLIERIEEIRGGANEKGYVIAEADGSSYYIPNALHIERDDSLVPWIFEDDEQAARGAEKDGVKLIYGMAGVDDGVYIDTPENRRIIENALAEREAVSAAAPSDPKLGGESNRHTLSVCFDNPEEEHSGWWLGFPATTESVHAVLKEIGVYSGDVVATDYSSGIPVLADRLGVIMEPDNIDELNYLAVRLQDLEGYGREIFAAALEAGKHCGSVKDIINLTFPENINRFDLLPFYDAGQYGEFLINNYHQDEHADAFNRLEQSEDPADRALAAHIERLEAHIDFEDYGRDVVSDERGVFTEQGYLTGGGGFTEIYRRPEDIPQEYRVFSYPKPEPLMKVENTDLSVLLLKMHALGGPYMPDAQYNLNILAGKDSHDYLLLMNGRNIYLTEALSAYQRGSTPFKVWMGAEENADTRVFAIHVRDQCGDGIIGDIAEINLRERQLDILHNSVYYTEVFAALKDGTEKKYLADAWDSLEPALRDRVQNWKERYDFDALRDVVRHLEDIRRDHAAGDSAVEPEIFLSDLNRRYMEKAPNPQPDMIRVYQTVAKDILARGDAAVFSLLPEGVKPLTPLDAVKFGSVDRYPGHLQFVVNKDALAGIDKWARREIGALNAKREQERDRLKNPKSHGEEL